jgi:putative ATP-binding cassette transporter
MSDHPHMVWPRSHTTIKLFFTSGVRTYAIIWFALLLFLLLSLSGLNVVNSYVGRDFMTAISKRDQAEFLRYAFLYVSVFAISSVMAAFYRFSEERLRLLWRGWLTRLLIDRYMANNTYYRITSQEEIDNPDERITEDVKSYTQTTLSFFLMTLNAVTTSLAFLGVLWSITPTLVVAALVYAALGSAAAYVLGRKLAELDNLQLQKEADLRYHLIQTRESAESIVSMRAERTVRDCLHARLDALVKNNRLIIAVTRNLGFFTNGYNYLIQIIPLLIVAPLYMRGIVEFGVVTQSAMAFAAFISGFSLVVTQFETLSTFAAVTSRIQAILAAVDRSHTSVRAPIHVVEDDTRIAYERLTLQSRHDNRTLIKDLTLVIPRGHNLLISGQDSSAASALFLATAGVWDAGEGTIHRPHLDAIVFVPKQPLTVSCSIRSQMLVPPIAREFSDDQFKTALDKVGLSRLLERVGGLDAEIDGHGKLSRTENKLIALSRVFLVVPRFVFLERMDGDLSPDQVKRLYGMLAKESITAVSIGDRHNLQPYHDSLLELPGEGKWRVIHGHAEGSDRNAAAALPNASG